MFLFFIHILHFFLATATLLGLIVYGARRKGYQLQPYESVLYRFASGMSIGYFFAYVAVLFIGWKVGSSRRLLCLIAGMLLGAAFVGLSYLNDYLWIKKHEDLIKGETDADKKSAE